MCTTQCRLSVRAPSLHFLGVGVVSLINRLFLLQLGSCKHVNEVVNICSARSLGLNWSWSTEMNVGLQSCGSSRLVSDLRNAVLGTILNANVQVSLVQ